MSGLTEPGFSYSHAGAGLSTNTQFDIYCVWNGVEFVPIPFFFSISKDQGWGERRCQLRWSFLFLCVSLSLTHPSSLHTAHTYSRTMSHPSFPTSSLYYCFLSSFLMYLHYIRLGNQVLCQEPDKWWHLVGNFRLHYISRMTVMSGMADCKNCWSHSVEYKEFTYSNVVVRRLLYNKSISKMRKVLEKGKKRDVAVRGCGSLIFISILQVKPS